MHEDRSLYLMLFNAVTDALAALDSGDPCRAKEILIKSQQNTEEKYISSDK